MLGVSQNKNLDAEMLHWLLLLLLFAAGVCIPNDSRTQQFKHCVPRTSTAREGVISKSVQSAAEAIPNRNEVVFLLWHWITFATQKKPVMQNQLFETFWSNLNPAGTHILVIKKLKSYLCSWIFSLHLQIWTLNIFSSIPTNRSLQEGLQRVISSQSNWVLKLPNC